MILLRRQGGVPGGMMKEESGHMQYVRLGNTGLEVSRICLGCMGYGDASRWIHPWVLNE